MSIHEIILAILATLSPPDAPADKDDQPQVKPILDHYFCCSTVDNAGKGSGTECRKTSEDESNLCSEVLCCHAGWTKSKGTVHCTSGTRSGAPSPTRFCCDSTGTDDVGHDIGHGCERSGEATCEASQLACFDSWTMSDGLVTCL